MNDFTKKELTWLCHELIEANEQYPLPKLGKSVLNKIKDMIINYDAKIIKVWHCEKCGHVQ